MDKNAIKKYAVWARRELISRVSQKALQYGISDKEIVPATATSVNGAVLSAEEMNQRKALIDRINSKSYEQVMEEVAYTWFNRFIALRFMEVNGYLPSRVRVFTDENNAFNPQILTEAISLELDGLDMEKVYALKDVNDNEGLFKYLIIVQCNALSLILPGMFQQISDYTELLFPDNLLRNGSAIEQMITMIPEEDWKDAVQIIGWLYQFYNIEPKAAVFAKNGKISKEEIPAATQLFTPDWIVRYMVENSLGRLWVEGHPNDDLKSEWKYYLEEAEQEPDVQEQLAKIRREYSGITPETIKCIDPCSGSGHILAYMFDVLMQIYEAYGYTAREAVKSIIENNIYGLDIDERAAQLAYFSVMMKARQYDRRFLTRKDEDGKPEVPQPRVYEIVESNGLDRSAIEYFIGEDAKIKLAMNSLISEMRDAKEYGSILKITPVDFSALYERFEVVLSDISIFNLAIEQELLPFVKTAEILAKKYEVTITNPPYMAIGSAGPKLNSFVKKNYPYGKADLYAVFMERCRMMTKSIGIMAMITMHSWMFLSSQRDLRLAMYHSTLLNMAHLGSRAFEEIGGEVVQTTAFVVMPQYTDNYVSTFVRLVSTAGQEEKRQAFFNTDNRHYASINTIKEIPDAPLAYWLSDIASRVLRENTLFDEVAKTRAGMITGSNEMFVRLWFEVAKSSSKYDCASREEAIDSGCKWFPYSKGGEFRRWYGNNDCVVNWENDGFTMRNHKDEKGNIPAHAFNLEYIFRDNVCWNSLSSNRFSARHTEKGYLYDAGGSFASLPVGQSKLYLGYLNSCVAFYYLSALNPTMNFQKGNVGNLPVVFVDDAKKLIVDKLVERCIKLSREDWDAFEYSWDFKKHPLVPTPCEWAEQRNSQFANGRTAKFTQLAWHYDRWISECQYRFDSLKESEEDLNRIFIGIYGLQDELTPDVEDKDVTIRLADQKRDIKSLISYAVGCMFGRYSLDVPGLVYAGGNIDEVYQKDVLGDGQGNAITFGEVRIAVSNAYTRVKAGDDWVDCTIPVDADNIIPICDDEYFTDDIVSRFIRFIETVYGKDTLQENLRFIADVLGGNGQPKDVIRNYFLNDFYADHLKIYQKRPIYWLFDSGKKGGFRALVYMHRYQPDTIARMRTDYVHEQQARYRTAIADLEQRMASASTSERVKLSKRLKKLQEQATEIQGYEEKIHHLADQYIAIDLDDGVKKNYEIFKDVLAKIK